MTHAPRILNRAGYAAGWLVAGVLLLAVASKLADLPAFVSELRTWEMLSSDRLRWTIGTVIPCLELSLGLCWCLNVGRSIVMGSSAVLLATFAIAYALESAYGHPACACFGLLRLRADMDASVSMVIARNAALVAAGTVVSYVTRKRGFERMTAVAASAEVHDPAARRASCRGWTLIELVLVIALMAVILALGLPSLAGVRDRGRQVRTLSNLRSNATVFSNYGNDFADHFPFFVDPTTPTSVIRSDGLSLAIVARYFDASVDWPIALADGYYQGRASPAWNDDFSPTGLYFYPCAFIAQPEFWNPKSRMAPPAQLGPTRTFQVLFPPHKVLLATDFSARTGSVSEWRIAAACVDAHAEVVPRSRALPQYHLGDGGPPWSIDVASTQSMLHTIDGVRGRDIE